MKKLLLTLAAFTSLTAFASEKEIQIEISSAQKTGATQMVLNPKTTDELRLNCDQPFPEASRALANGYLIGNAPSIGSPQSSMQTFGFRSLEECRTIMKKIDTFFSKRTRVNIFALKVSLNSELQFPLKGVVLGVIEKE